MWEYLPCLPKGGKCACCDNHLIANDRQRGYTLCEGCRRTVLVVGNKRLRFVQGEAHWYDADGTEQQLDYFVARPRWRDGYGRFTTAPGVSKKVKRKTTGRRGSTT
jgi:hypothetical protein